MKLLVTTLSGCLFAMCASSIDRYVVKVETKPEFKTIVYKSEAPATISDLACGDKRCLAVGHGFILESTEGPDTEKKFTSWKDISPKDSSYSWIPLYGISFGNRYWVAVGSQGTILTKKDGSDSWERSFSGTIDKLSAVAYGNGHWVSIGDNTVLVAQNPADKWKEVAKGISRNLLALAYGDAYWLIAYSNKILASKSLNGMLREVYSRGWLLDADFKLRDITYADGQWLAVGNHNIVLVSNISVGPSSWKRRKIANERGRRFYPHPHVAAYKDGQFLLSGYREVEVLHECLKLNWASSLGRLLLK